MSGHVLTDEPESTHAELNLPPPAGAGGHRMSGPSHTAILILGRIAQIYYSGYFAGGDVILTSGEKAKPLDFLSLERA